MRICPLRNIECVQSRCAFFDIAEWECCITLITTLLKQKEGDDFKK